MLCNNFSLTENNSNELFSIEQEKYYRTIDRISSENILRNRVSGSMLVRPNLNSDVSKFLFKK